MLATRFELLRQHLSQHQHHKKQDDERDVERQKLRDKYNIAKPVNEDEESEDPMERAIQTKYTYDSQ